MVYEELAGSTFVNSFQTKSKAGNFSYFFFRTTNFISEQSQSLPTVCPSQLLL